MSLSGTYSLTVAALGVTVAGEASRTGTVGIEPVDTTLPVGHAGTLTTATIALVTGHGLTTGTFDVHGAGWCRYGCTLTITVDSAVVTGGAGDSLADGAVVVTAAVTLDVTFDGDNLSLLGVGCNRQARVTFYDTNDVVLYSVFLVANNAWGWADDLGGANPLTGNAVAYVLASNGSSTLTATLKITGLQYA